MPRGVPKSGVRMTMKKMAQLGITSPTQVNPAMMAQLTTQPAFKEPTAPVKVETDEEIEAKLANRFEVLYGLASGATEGEIRALIASGPPGLGKSFTIEQCLKDWDPEQDYHTITKGYVKATGLYRLLWQHRHAGQVLVFDDADSVFLDDTALNMLKAACDTTEERYMSYLSEYDMYDEDEAMNIPKTFLFEGTIIFITNYDFDGLIERGHRLAPHFAALLSRAHYVDLGMKTSRDYLVRIRMVMKEGLLKTKGLNEEQTKDVVDFIEENFDALREKSLRMALKIADIRKMPKVKDWMALAKVTCLKNS